VFILKATFRLAFRKLCLLPQIFIQTAAGELDNHSESRLLLFSLIKKLPISAMP
jgi:hypothetical protein